LRRAQKLVADGERQASVIAADMEQTLLGAGVTHIDYVTIADPNTLAPLRRVDQPAVALVAAHVGDTRLIDNCLLLRDEERE
jgi:pantoate--beta-alanine ligase